MANIRTITRRLRTAVRVMRGFSVNEPPMFIDFATAGNKVYGAQVLDIKKFSGEYNYYVEHSYISLIDGIERMTTAWVAASQLL